MGTDPQELFGAGLWSRHVGRMRRSRIYVLERRQTSDPNRWIWIGRYVAKEDARRALRAARAALKLPNSDLRVRRVRAHRT